MQKDQIRIGSDGEDHPVYLQGEGSGTAVLTGGSVMERQQVLRSLAESASRAGVPVFLTDTRGSLSGLSSAFPCTLWDLYGSSGLPLRTTVTEMGPLLMAQLLGLNENQSELLRIVFRIADDRGLLLIDTKDLKALLDELTGNAPEYEKEYGAISRQSVSSVLHALVALETAGAENYLFEPAIDIRDFLQTEDTGEGRIHLLDAQEQSQEEMLYACFLLFLLGEGYETFPSADGQEDIRLVMMIDEAQEFLQILDGSLLRKLRRILEGLNERGVMVCLSLSAKEDLPEELQHVPGIWLQLSGTDLLFLQGGLSGEGEEPDRQRKMDLYPSVSSTRPLSAQERAMHCSSDPLQEKYKIPFDRDSAFEFLKRRGIAQEEEAETETENAAAPDPAQKEEETVSTENKTSGSGEDSLQQMAGRAKSSAKSLGKTVAGTVGRQIGKSIGSTFGSFGETLGGNIGASLGRGIINTLFKS